MSHDIEIKPNDKSSRRTFLEICASLGGAAFFGELPGWGETEAEQAKGNRAARVRFGRTELQVSRLCQGTAFRQIGRAPDNAEGQQILHRCFDLGINFFDTAEAYGWGGAESGLGKAIAGKRDRFVICTKAATTLNQDPATKIKFSRDVLFRKAEGSLK